MEVKVDMNSDSAPNLLISPNSVPILRISLSILDCFLEQIKGDSGSAGLELLAARVIMTREFVIQFMWQQKHILGETNSSRLKEQSCEGRGKLFNSMSVVDTI